LGIVILLSLKNGLDIVLKELILVVEENIKENLKNLSETELEDLNIIIKNIERLVLKII
jgi:hypothetical protein